jgi:hypothetical protein
MKRTTVFLDEGLERDLKALAARKGEPAASLVREALGEYIVRQRSEAPRLGFLAAGRSGRSDVAETHEELLFRELSPHGRRGPRGVVDSRSRAGAGPAPARRRRRRGAATPRR